MAKYTHHTYKQVSFTLPTTPAQNRRIQKWLDKMLDQKVSNKKYCPVNHVEYYFHNGRQVTKKEYDKCVVSPIG